MDTIDKEKLLQLTNEKSLLKIQLDGLYADLQLNDYCDDFQTWKYNNEKIKDSIGAIIKRINEIDKLLE